MLAIREFVNGKGKDMSRFKIDAKFFRKALEKLQSRNAEGKENE